MLQLAAMPHQFFEWCLSWRLQSIFHNKRCYHCSLPIKMAARQKRPVFRPLWKIHVHSAGLMPPQFKSSFKTGKTIHPVSAFRSTGALLKPPHLQVSSLKTKQAILEHLPDLRAVTFHVYMVPQVDDSHFTLWEHNIHPLSGYWTLRFKR